MVDDDDDSPGINYKHLEGISAICIKCFEKLGNNFKNKYYFCRKCIKLDKEYLDVDEKTPVRNRHPNPGY
jgi:hypothetical protein